MLKQTWSVSYSKTCLLLTNVLCFWIFDVNILTQYVIIFANHLLLLTVIQKKTKSIISNMKSNELFVQNHATFFECILVKFKQL